MEFDTIDTSLWDEIQDMPGEIFDIEDWIGVVFDDNDLTEDGLESVTNFAAWNDARNI